MALDAEEILKGRKKPDNLNDLEWQRIKNGIRTMCDPRNEGAMEQAFVDAIMQHYKPFPLEDEKKAIRRAIVAAFGEDYAAIWDMEEGDSLEFTDDGKTIIHKADGSKIIS